MRKIRARWRELALLANLHRIVSRNKHLADHVRRKSRDEARLCEFAAGELALVLAGYPEKEKPRTGLTT